MSNSKQSYEATKVTTFDTLFLEILLPADEVRRNELIKLILDTYNQTGEILGEIDQPEIKLVPVRRYITVSLSNVGIKVVKLFKGDRSLYALAKMIHKDETLTSLIVNEYLKGNLYLKPRVFNDSLIALDLVIKSNDETNV